MRFLVKEISSTRKELRVTLNAVESNNVSAYVFGSIGGVFDENTVESKYIPPTQANYYNIGPNPGIIRTIVAYLKDTLGSLEGFKNTVLITKDGHKVPILNIAIDDISLINLTSDTIPSMVIKLMETLPSSLLFLDEISIETQIIVTQEQEVYYISADEPPAVIRGLAYDEGMKEEIGNPDASKLTAENMDTITGSIKQADNTLVAEFISGSETNLKIDYSDFKNHTHFGSAASKLVNFKSKVSQIEDYLVHISQSLITSSLNTVDNFRETTFDNIQIIKNTFTPYEKALYYNSDTLGYKYNVNLGPNYTKPYAISKTTSAQLQNYNGFKLVYHASGSNSGSGDIELFRDIYDVEDKPFYNYSGSFYLSFLMKGDESINGGGTSRINWKNNQKYHIPKLPIPTLYTSSILQPPIQSESWQRYIYLASSSYWAPAAENPHGPIIGMAGTMTNFDNEDEITILHGSDVTGSYSIIAGGRYTNLATEVTSSGAPFTGSISPAGELFRIWIEAGGYGGPSTAVTSSYLTDIRITKYNPINSTPFSEVFSTGSSEFTNWYDDQYASASSFDTENVHSFTKSLPAFLDDNTRMNNDTFKSFVNMSGEYFDLIKNYIDGFDRIFKTQYGEVGSVPDNLLPILAQNYNWNFMLPFGKSDQSALINFAGSGFTSLDTTSKTKNNIWRNIINNINYIYKTKGTHKSIRALLNSYGFPPDILKIREAGASMDQSENEALSDDLVASPDGLGGASGNISFTQKEDKMVSYIMDHNTVDRKINAEWRRDGVAAQGIEFVFKPSKGEHTQIILESSGSSTDTLWDIILEPSASDKMVSRLTFRINNDEDGDDTMGSPDHNTISMSTNYFKIKNQNHWNVLLQRTAGPSGSDTYTSHSYEMFVGEQKGDKINNLQVISMSYGGLDYSHSAANFIGTGSRPSGDSGNLVIGKTMTGSMAEFRTWKYPLSASAFKQHIFDKKSAVGNTALDSQTNLIYHFRLNENWPSGSSNPHIKDYNVKNIKDYQIPITQTVLSHEPLYDTDSYDRIQFNVGIGGAYELSDNSILIDMERRFINNLNPFEPSVMNVYHPLINKRKASTVLEITRSPQEVINDFILNQLGNFDFNDKFADPRDISKIIYGDLEAFAKQFFDYYDISMDVNKFITAQAAIFNKELINSLKRLVPARAIFSKVGVELKPTFLDRQKLNPSSLSKEILSFEATITFNDLSKNIYSFRKLHTLYPTEFYAEAHIEIYSHTGSRERYYSFNEFELWTPYEITLELASITGSKAGLPSMVRGDHELYQPLQAHIELASPTGSSQGYYDYTNKYEVSKTRDVNIDLSQTSSLVIMSSDLFLLHDMNFSVASSTGSISWEFVKLEPLEKIYEANYYSHDKAIKYEERQGWDRLDKANDANKNGYMNFSQNIIDYQNISFVVASSTGSISWDFTKNEPLHTNYDFNFYSHKNVKYEERQGWDRLDKANDANENGYLNFSNDLLKTHDVNIEISSVTASVPDINPGTLYQNRDFSLWDGFINVRSGSNTNTLIKFNNYLNTPKEFNFWDGFVDFQRGSSKSAQITLNNALAKIYTADFYDGVRDIKYEERQGWDRLDKTNDANENGYINFHKKLQYSKDVTLINWGHSGSQYHDYTNQYALYDYHQLYLFGVNHNTVKDSNNKSNFLIIEAQEHKDMVTNLINWGHSGSQYHDYTNQYTLYDTYELQLTDGENNVIKDNNKFNYLTLEEEKYENNNLDLLNITNNVATDDSDFNYLSLDNEKYENNNLDLLNITNNVVKDNNKFNYLFLDSEKLIYHNKEWNLASSTGSLTWNFNNYQPLYQNKNIDNVGNMDNYFKSTSNNLSFKNKLYVYKTGKLYDIHENFNSHNSNQYFGYVAEPHHLSYKDVIFNFSGAGISSLDFTNNSELYEYMISDLDTKERNSGGNPSSSLSFVNSMYKYNDVSLAVANGTSSNPEISTEINIPREGTLYFIGNTDFYSALHKGFSDLSSKWGTGDNDTHFIHYGYAGKNNDYNTYHYEKRYIFHAYGDVESLSGSYVSISSSFKTDFEGKFTNNIYTASRDFQNQRFIKLNDFSGLRPLGTTSELKPTGSIQFGGIFFDEIFIYPANHTFVVGTSRDSIDDLIYKGTQNTGGDIIESEEFTDLSTDAFYFILNTGASGFTVQQN